MNEKLNATAAATAPEIQQAADSNSELAPKVKAIGAEQLTEFTRILNKYRDGKRSVDERMRGAEQWWKLRNAEEEEKEGHKKSGFKSRSAWLHSVIRNKHADAMDAFPEPNILPRERDDKREAAMLSKIVPCVLEKNQFETVYSAAMWSKMKFGTAVYKIIWDKNKLNGLGDISISRCNVLNLFWEPGVEDIQQSKYFFEVDFQDEDELKEAFPQLANQNIKNDIYTSKFRYDDTVDTSDKVPVINVYYHKKGILHYCLYVPNIVLYATENDTEVPMQAMIDPETGIEMQAPTGEKPMSERGMYDHGKYPYVFDALFPVEGSPCGYGLIDLHKEDQTEIDLMKTAMVENAMVGAKPRYFYREGTGINVKEFLDLNNTLIKVDGAVSEDYIFPITYNPLPGNYINLLEQTITQLRETSGNTETSTGTANHGVTSASGILALQEASGKTSRDSSQASYRAYSEICFFTIENIRQSYDIPRQFRIVGESGAESYVDYDNRGLKPQQQLGALGDDMGYRLPIFDIKVVPQKRSAYQKMANNDLALQLYGLGFFNPQMTDQATACLSVMDFDGKDEMGAIIKRNGDMFQQIQMLQQYAMTLAQKYQDGQAMQQLQMLMAQAGMSAMPEQTAGATMPKTGDYEDSRMKKARQQARSSAMPTEGAQPND